MLRLDPTHPPLWRSATALQLGLDPVVVIDDPAPWQQRLIRELERGVADAALEPLAAGLGAPPQQARTFLSRLAAALERDVGDRQPVIVQSTEDSSGVADHVAESLEHGGREVCRTTWHGARHDGLAPGAAWDDAPVIVVTHHLVEPRRAAALMRIDRPHLPIVFSGSRVGIGPLVRPGVSACLACVAAHRRDDDPMWPHVAAQLVGRAGPPVPPLLAQESGIVAAHLLDDALRHPTRLAVRSISLRADSLHRSTTIHRPHRSCRCRSLAGTVTAGDPESRAPTTATAFARPA